MSSQALTSVGYRPVSLAHERATAGRLPTRSRWLPSWAVPLVWAAALVLLAAVVYSSPSMASRVFLLLPFGIAAAVLVWSRPGVGVLAIIFVTAGLTARGRLTLPVAGIRLDPADLTLVVLAVALAYAQLGRRPDPSVRWWIGIPLLGFATIAVLSASYARLLQHVNLGLVLGELRPAVYCAGCALATLAAVRRGQLKLLLIGLFAIADATAAALILAQFSSAVRDALPAPPLGLWQINSAGQATGGFGAERLVPPAHVLVYLMDNVGFCLLLARGLSRRLRTLLVLQLLLLSVGLLLTYTRAQWIATSIALLLACVLLPRDAKRRLAHLFVLLVPLSALVVAGGGLGLASVGASSPLQQLVARGESVFQPSDTFGTASLQWRTFEDGAALRSIEAHPLFGVGLGNSYRSRTLLQGEASGWLYPLDGDSSLTRFVHNGYLYLTVKLGLIAAALFAAFYLATIVLGIKFCLRTRQAVLQLTVLGCICSLVGLLEWVTFEPHFMLPAGMAAVGVAVGLVLASFPDPRAGARLALVRRRNRQRSWS